MSNKTVSTSVYFIIYVRLLSSLLSPCSIVIQMQFFSPSQPIQFSQKQHLCVDKTILFYHILFSISKSHRFRESLSTADLCVEHMPSKSYF